MDISPEQIKFLAQIITPELTISETADLAIALFTEGWEMTEDEIREELDNALKRKGE